MNEVANLSIVRTADPSGKVEWWVVHNEGTTAERKDGPFATRSEARTRYKDLRKATPAVQAKGV